MNTPFHLIYEPGDTIRGTTDRIIDLIQTSNPQEVNALVNIGRGAIVLELEAQDKFEADAEIRELGFSL